MSTSAVALTAQADSTLVVKVLNVQEARGELLVALYDDPADWNKPELAKYTRIVSATTGRVDVDFAHLAPGRYAVAVLHDRDSNGVMTTMMGLPREPYGFGNDARGIFGPPTYEQSLITFDGRGSTKVTIK